MKQMKAYCQTIVQLIVCRYERFKYFSLTNTQWPKLRNLMKKITLALSRPNILRNILPAVTRVTKTAMKFKRMILTLKMRSTKNIGEVYRHSNLYDFPGKKTIYSYDDKKGINLVWQKQL